MTTVVVDCSLLPEDEMAYKVSRYIVASLYLVQACIVLFFLVPLFREKSGKVWQKLFYTLVLLGTLGKTDYLFIYLVLL
jgi:lipoprotein signal peptidase